MDASVRHQIYLLLIVSIGLAYCEPPLSNQYGYSGNSNNGNFVGGNNGNLGGGNNNYRPNDGGHSYDDGHNNNQDYADNYPKSYEFGYAIKDATTGNDFGRRETSDGETVRGEYRVQLPDGRTQIVTYTADWRTGFHADVRYEGTATYPDQYNTQNNAYNNNNNNNNQGYDFQGNSINNGYNGGNNAGYNNNNNNNNYKYGGSNYNQNNYQFGTNALDNNYNFGDVTRNTYKPPVYGPPVG
ncbi:probable serine/threonine-protein kinase clkA [Vespa mandarinia]|uniref:probable serine/threonine-protein kinase clkA n=1 Tax=Vespa mandarinia TaxID=7446 RepID=UPI00161B6983|nr:probable serine/threonine-protein kinase clkA [Vespa mandarinia]